MANYPNHCFIFVGSTQARHCCCRPASLATPTATTLTATTLTIRSQAERGLCTQHISKKSLVVRGGGGANCGGAATAAEYPTEF